MLMPKWNFLISDSQLPASQEAAYKGFALGSVAPLYYYGEHFPVQVEA